MLRARISLLILVGALAMNTGSLAQPHDTARVDTVMGSSLGGWISDHWEKPNTTRTERIGYVLGATAMFSLADYIGFNALKSSYIHAGNPPAAFTAPPWFRFAEAGLQAGLSYLLYDQVGLSSSIAFNLMWWTWCDDFAYYGWGYTTGLYSWESSHETGLRFHEYASAGWTPIGLVRPQGSAIAKSTLLAQSVTGLTISMVILW